jgi:hypothetical protein
MPTESRDPKALARIKLAERRLRIRKLRRNVIAVSVTVFVAVWGVIFVTLASGNDPVLSAKAQSATTATTSGSTSGSTSTGSGSGSSATTSSGSGSGSSGVSSVTTQQS